MSIEPRFEIGVDYDGVSPRHHQVNEIRNFSNDKTDRIFFPECGAFYTDTLVIKDINTGKELIRNEDYECMIIDAKATKLSGKEACGVINIINLNVTGIKIDYQFVGGLHMTGYYLLEQILKMYPNGASAIISFDDLINVPTEHDPAYHKQHVHEFFGTDTLLVWLERLRQGIVFRQENNLKKMYNQAQAAIDDLYATLQNNYDRLKYEIQETFKKISIQTDEYILTDSDVNPAISRGYGEWQLITDSVLYGVAGTTYLIGSGGGISIGGEQIIRNCYIWKNITGSSLTETVASVTADKSSIAEGETITFTVKVSNTPDNTSHPWAISGADSTDFTTAITGNVIIVNGEGTVTVTAKKDYITDGDKNYIFYLINYAKARKAFVVLDTSQTSKILNVNFIDNSGVVLSMVTEDQTFRLAINTNGMIGRTVYPKWIFSAGLSASNFSTSFPDSIVITSNTTYLTLTTIGNLTADVARSLKVIVAESIDEEEHSLSKTAIVDILDTSTQFSGAISFLDNNGLIISSLDEGNLFKIRLKTNGGVGKTVRFEYQTNKEAYEFSGLVASDAVKTGNEVIIPVEHFADYVTRVEPEFLVVKAYDGVRLIAEGTLMFNDTSKTPNFQVIYSKKNDGSEPITVVNEGEVFYLIFQVPGWIGSTAAPIIDVQYTLTGQPDLASRVQMPTKTTGFSFDGKNNTADVEWVNNNTLAIKCTTVADKAINGNAVFSFKWKTSVSSNFSNPIDLSIIDTSQPVLNASWSSSNANLIPVTSVDEMTSLGERKLVYLWINIDGNAATYQNLKLKIGDRTTASSDLITVFPQTLTLANGLTKHIVTIEIDNDFITEGNEILQIVATADNVDGDIFAAEITIVDNSVRTTLTGNVSTSATEVVAPTDGKFSEWNPAYIIVNHPAFAFATKLELTTSDVAKLHSYTTQVTVLANTTQSVITLVSANQRNTWGDHEHVVTYKRTFDGKDLTPTYSTTVKFKNDKVPPSISNAFITTDVLGNDLAGALREGMTYYAHATINNPASNMVGVIGIIDDTDNGIYAGLTRLSFADNKKVLIKSVTESPTPIKMSTSFTIVNDRKNNDTVAKLRLAYKIDWSSTKTVGQLYDESITVGDSSSVVVIGDHRLEDTSRTINISDVTFKDVNGVDATEFDEGDEVYFHVTLTQATIGDVYSISNDDTRYLGISLDRFSYHEFDSKDITITSSLSQTLIYKATLKMNRFTDTAKYGYVKLNNKTTGTTVDLGGSFTVNDTSKTPEVTINWLAENNATITSVNEGATFKLRVKTLNLDPGMTVKLTRISGRPLTDFSTSEVAVVKVLAADGIYQTADFNFTLKNNATTDAVNTFTVKWEVVELTSINGEATISVIDTSQTRGFLTTEWRAVNENGALVSSINEGNTVALVVTASGGTQPLDIQLVNDGGRVASKMVTHGYGVTKTRSSNTQKLVWLFNATGDKTANIASDLRLKVKLSFVDSPEITTTATLPINDTSNSANSDFYVYVTSDVTRTPVANIMEGIQHTVFATVYPSADSSNTFLEVNNPVYGFNNQVVSALPTEDASQPVTHSFSFTVNDYKVTPAADLWLDFTTYGGGIASTTTRLAIVDSATVTAKITSDSAGNTAISSANEGSVVYLALSSTNIASGQVLDWTASGHFVNSSGVTVAESGTTTLNTDGKAVIAITINEDELTSPSRVLNATIKSGGVTVATITNFVINDTSKTPTINNVYWSTNQNGTDSITTAANNDTVYLIIKSINVLKSSNEFSLSFQGSTVAASDIVVGSIEGTQLISMGTYNNSTGDGHTWYALKFV